MRHLRLFENFNDIDKICQKYNIENYTINEDGSIDVDGDVNLSGKKLTKIPLKFRNVTRNFNCCDNKLTSLEGCPEKVGRDFNCYDNKLTSLEGCPESVGGDFYCGCNKLISLDGCPESVGGDFYSTYNQLVTLGGGLYCSNNPIYTIYSIFNDYVKFKNSMDYSYLRGREIIRTRFQEALDELGIEMPKKIIGYNYI